MAVTIEQFDVVVATLDPTVGAEMRKSRPCVVVSPPTLNQVLQTVIVAPLTSARRRLPFRVDSHIAGRSGQIALDQIRAVDTRRLTRRIARLDRATAKRVLQIL